RAGSLQLGDVLRAGGRGRIDLDLGGIDRRARLAEHDLGGARAVGEERGGERGGNQQVVAAHGGSPVSGGGGRDVPLPRVNRPRTSSGPSRPATGSNHGNGRGRAGQPLWSSPRAPATWLQRPSPHWPPLR